MNIRSCNDELSIKLTGKLTLELPELQFDTQKQLRIKEIIDTVIYNYEILSKETSLVASDIEEKYQLFLACKKLEGLSKKTLNNYLVELRIFSRFFNKPVSTINSMDIRMYMSSIGQGIQENTLNTKMTPIRIFFQWLQDEEYIISNPTKKIKHVKEPKRERDPLSDMQVETIRDSNLNKREKALFEFLLATGCRVGEIVNIKTSDIDWTRMSLLVIGKGNKQRRIYFNERAKLSMKKYLESRKEKSAYLFCSHRKTKGDYLGLSTRAVQDEIKRIEIKSGVDKHLHPHIFRHTFATKALNSGMPLEVVQSILGHSTVSTTQIYAKIKESNVEFMYKKIAV